MKIFKLAIGLTLFASFIAGCVAKEITFTILNEMGKGEKGTPYKYKISRNPWLTELGDNPIAKYTDHEKQSITFDDKTSLFNRGNLTIVTTKVIGTHKKVSHGIPSKKPGVKEPYLEYEVATYATVEFKPENGATYKIYFEGNELKIKECKPRRVLGFVVQSCP